MVTPGPGDYEAEQARLALEAKNGIALPKSERFQEVVYEENDDVPIEGNRAFCRVGVASHSDLADTTVVEPVAPPPPAVKPPRITLKPNRKSTAVAKPPAEEAVGAMPIVVARSHVVTHAVFCLVGVH